MNISGKRQQLEAHLTPAGARGAGGLCRATAPAIRRRLMRVRLFGSKVRGDFHGESDLDLLIVVRMTEGAYRRYWREIVGLSAQVGLEYGFVTSLVIKDEPRYARMCQHRLLLARNIEKDGIDLWTKQPNELTFAPA